MIDINLVRIAFAVIIGNILSNLLFRLWFGIRLRLRRCDKCGKKVQLDAVVPSVLCSTCLSRYHPGPIEHPLS